MERERAARCGRLVLLLGVRSWGCNFAIAWSFSLYGF